MLENFRYLDRFKNRTMKLSKSLPFYKTRLSLTDLLMILILFLLKFYLKGISYLSELKGTVFVQKKTVFLNRGFDLTV